MEERSNKGNVVLIEASLGELADRITILRIKADRIKDEKKLRNVRRELASLEGSAASIPLEEADLAGPLSTVNKILWEVEDALRERERMGRFDDFFVFLARAVYHLNDERARLKREIDERYGSAFTDEKSHPSY